MPATDQDTEPNPLQAAIRARALATLENAERQPRPTLRRKLTMGLFAVLVVVGLSFTFDMVIRVMHHILIVWYGDPAESVQPVPKFDPSKPFYITVDPPLESSSAAANSSTPSK
jgi:hypothetical protein